MLIASTTFSLFILLNPIGNVPLYLTNLKGIDPKRQRIIILREKLIALATICLFTLAGQAFLNFLNIDQHTLQIAGGIILFLLALKMIFPVAGDPAISNQQNEPFIVPLAIPLVAGPGTLTAVILYSAQVTTLAPLFLAILLAWTASLAILLSSFFLTKILGNRGITACERLMGLILTLIAVQMFLNGAHLFFNGTHSV